MKLQGKRPEINTVVRCAIAAAVKGLRTSRLRAKMDSEVKSMFTAAIIGLPMVGKTTIFNLVTAAGVETSKFLSGKSETNVGTALVPDRRIDFLSRLYQPRKTT